MMISVALVFIISVFFYYVKKEKKLRSLPPGKHGWPIIGFIPSFRIPMWEHVEESRRQFGDIFMWKIFNRKIVLLCNPKLIKTAFQAPALSAKPVGTKIKHQFGKPSNDSSDLEEKEYQTLIKKLGKYHLLSEKIRGSGLEEYMSLDQCDFVEKIKDVQEDGKNLADILEAFKLTIFNVVIRIITGIKNTEIISMEERKEILKSFKNLWDGFVTREVYHRLFPEAGFFIKRIFPSVHLDRINVYNFMLRLFEIMKNTKEDSSSFLKTNLNYQKNRQFENGKMVSEEMLMALCKNILYSSHDSMCSSFYHVLDQMVVHPEIQAKVRAEIDSVVPRERYPSLMDKDRLPYTQAVIFESMRRFPLFPLGAFHRATEDVLISNYLIPKGAIVMSSIYSCHYDSKFWAKPDEFYPEHFLDDHGNFMKNNEGFLPFSKGPRSCPGAILVESILFTWFASVIQNFTLSCSDDVNLDKSTQYEKFLLQLKLIQKDIKFHLRK